MEQVKILVVDDDQSLLRVMQHHLTEAGYPVAIRGRAEEGLREQRAEPAGVVFTDLRMPGMGGIEFIQRMREFDQTAIIVVITGFPTVDAAVESMKEGAFDFVQKPVEKGPLLAVARRAADHYRLRSENRRLRTLVAEHLDFGNMIGRSQAMQQVYHQARAAAGSNATILIAGETGTGKEMLARAIHRNSARGERSFVTINCAAVPATLLESELFGHVKGAFTGAMSERKGLVQEADRGTLFLDEIGDLPLELQPKLLRVLQEKEIQPVGANTVTPVDVRFVVATHRNLEEMVENSVFRQDLYFRLNVVPLTLPPVRERREDILPLFHHFLHEAAESEGKETPAVDRATAARLEDYAWPGNVREIQNLAQRLMVLHQQGSIAADELPESIKESPPAEGPSPAALPSQGIDLEEWTDRLILAALEKNDWNQSRTARYLNISRNTLVYRIDKHQNLHEAWEKHGQGGG